MLDSDALGVEPIHEEPMAHASIADEHIRATAEEKMINLLLP